MNKVLNKQARDNIRERLHGVLMNEFKGTLLEDAELGLLDLIFQIRIEKLEQKGVKFIGV